MASEYDERHLSLMAFSCAPMSTLLDNLPEEDFDLAIFAEEMDLYEKFTRLGLNLFIESVKDLNENDETEETDQSEAVLPTGKIVHKKAITQLLTLYLTPFYLRRVIQRAHVLEKLADTVRKNVFQGMTLETTDELRRMERMIQDGERPNAQDTDMSEALDLMPGLEWELPKLFAASRSTNTIAFAAPSPSRVNFRETAQQLIGGETSEAPLKPGGNNFARRKGRNPTGFPKYTPAELARLAAAQVDDEDEPSSSAGAPDYDEDSQTESHPFESQPRHQSSFDLQNNVMIEDKYADPEWAEKERAQKRISRVRNRVPTGHPNMMAKALRARQSLEESDPETQTNTEANSVRF